LTILVNICGGRSYCDAKNIIIPVLVSLKAETRMLTQKSALEQAAVQLAHVGGGEGEGWCKGTMLAVPLVSVSIITYVMYAETSFFRVSVDLATAHCGGG